MTGRMLWAIAGTALAVSAYGGIGRGFVREAKTAAEIEDAVRAVRAARQAGKLAADERAEVRVAPGTYRFGRTLKLGKEDSHLVIRAERKGTVRITGGIDLPLARFAAVTDGAMRARFPEAVRDKVRVADLSGELGDLPPWPDETEGMPPAPYLYSAADGRALPLARWPNGTDYWFFTNVVHDGFAPDPKDPSRKIKVPGAFSFPGDRIDRWRIGDGVWLYGYFRHDWASDMVRIAAFEKDTRTVRLAAPLNYGLGTATWGVARRRICALNLPEELDEPGEWWLDRRTKRLYLLPLDGTAGYALATDAPRPLELDGAEDVALENLDFDYFHGGETAVSGASRDYRCPVTPVAVWNGRRCRISDCSVRCSAGGAFTLTGEDVRAERCTIEHVGGLAVWMGGGDRRALVNGRVALVDSRITDYGVFKRTFAPAVSMEGCGNAVRGCKIEQGPYISLWYYGNEHLIADNEFSHVVREACDSGAVYSGYDPSSLGNLLFGNYVHDLGEDRSMWAYRMGFYFDDCDWGDAVIGNTFERVGIGSMIGGGNLHPFHNNLFADCIRAINLDSRGVSWQKRGAFRPDAEGRPFAEWKVLAVGGDPRRGPWRTAYPELAALVSDSPELPWGNDVSGNVAAGCPLVNGLGADLQACTNRWHGNRTLANRADAPARAPQPIALSAAAENRLSAVVSNVQVEATIGLDVAGRLSWRVAHDGVEILRPSPLGVTVGLRDYGKLVVPLAAREGADGVKSIPLADLVTGREVAALEAKIAADGAALVRWRVPASEDGVPRTVYGEMDGFRFANGGAFAEAPSKDAPKSLWWAKSATTNLSDVIVRIVHPDHPSGWKTRGEILSPWRGVR